MSARLGRLARLAAVLGLQLAAALLLASAWFHFFPPKLRVQTIDPHEWRGVAWPRLSFCPQAD